MQQILGDIHLDERLLKEEYVVVPFLSEDEVAQLTAFYAENHPGKRGHVCHGPRAGCGLRMRMNDFIKQVFARADQAKCL